MELSQVRSMIGQYIKDGESPGKVDKYEELELKDKLTSKGEALAPAVKEYLKDQIKTEKFEKGKALTELEGLVNEPDPPKPKTKIELIQDQINDIDKQIGEKRSWLNQDGIKNYYFCHAGDINQTKREIKDLQALRSDLSIQVTKSAKENMGGTLSETSFIQERVKKIDKQIGEKQSWLNQDEIKHYYFCHAGDINQTKKDIEILREEKKNLLEALAKKHVTDAKPVENE